MPTIVHEQDGAGADAQFLRFTLGTFHLQNEIGFGQMGFHPVGRPVGPHPCLGTELHGAFDRGAHHPGFGRGHTAGMEGAHRELGAGLTDRLGGDDTHRFAEIDQFVVSQGPAVALAAHRTRSLAGERRTHHHGAYPGRLDAAGEGRIDLAVAVDDHRAIGVEHRLTGQPTHQLGGVLTLVVGIDRNAAGGAAVFLPHDHILGHVHQTAGEVSRVGGAQGRVHQALAGPVGRNHVFGDR